MFNVTQYRLSKRLLVMHMSLLKNIFVYRVAGNILLHHTRNFCLDLVIVDVH